MEAAPVGTYVNGDNIALMNNLLSGNAVDYHIIDGNAGAGRKTAVAKERRSRSLGYDVVMNCLVDGMGSSHRDESCHQQQLWLLR